jgi:hypothetical protein
MQRILRLRRRIRDMLQRCCGFAAGLETCCNDAAASPPDVWRGSAPPEAPRKTAGLCPWFGLCPRLSGQRPYQGRSPVSIFSRHRRGIASPHIRRRSRGESTARAASRQSQIPPEPHPAGAVSRLLSELHASRSRSNFLTDTRLACSPWRR